MKLQSDGKADLFIPSFCMAECSKAFARELGRQYKDADEFREKLIAYREPLLDAVSSGRNGVIQSLKLERKHLENIEDIFVAEKRTHARSEHEGLSGLDALIITIGRSHASEHGHDNVWIVTADEWLARICNRAGEELPRAIDVMKQSIPDG
jgi:hypothetical protein